MSAGVKPIEIYHIEGRRSFRVAWLCEELAIPYKLIFQKDDIFASIEAIRAAHPIMPMAPAVVIDGHTVVESGAILDILLARSANNAMRPSADSEDFLYHTQWMHFAEGTAQARMLGWRLVASALELDVDELPEGYRPNSPVAVAPPQSSPTALMNFLIGPRAIFEAIEAYLSDRSYFGGSEFSAADIMMYYQVRHSMLMSQINLNDYPVTAKWRGRVEQRPAYIRADKAAQPGGVDEHGLPIGSPMPFPVRRSRN